VTRPIQPDADEAAGLFSIDRFDVGNVTGIDRVAGLKVVTDARQWSHALEFRPLTPAGFKDRPLLVDVHLEVESGSIEVGALSTPGTSFLSAATVGPGTHTVVLQIPALARCQSVSIRNASGFASVVRVASMAVRSDGTVEDDTNLSAPYGCSPRGFWDKNIFADIRRLAGAESRVVFHVGAHDGEESALFLQIFGDARVHCFEPSPATFVALQRKLSGEPRAELNQLALSDRSGIVPFRTNRRPETDSLFPLVSAGDSDDSESSIVVEVRSSTIDEQLERIATPVIDVLCLDTQGAELQILHGASRALQHRLVRVLMTELIWVPLYEGQGTYFDVLHFLGHNGYRLYDLYNFRYSESGQVLWGDALFLPDQAPSH
jgi:FkbM family methyltransferase